MEKIITLIRTWENYKEKTKIQFLMFNVLNASCQDIWVHSSYTLALIYSTTTAGCSRTKPLQLQPAAQDPPQHRECRTSFISGMWNYSNIATFKLGTCIQSQTGWQRADALLTQLFQVLIDIRQPLEVGAALLASITQQHSLVLKWWQLSSSSFQGWSRWEGTTLPNG